MTKTETKVNIQPLADRVVLEVIDDNDQTPGGIYIPDTAREKPVKGRVVAVGPGRMLESGAREAMTVKVGDTVLFAKYGGTDIKLSGNEYKIIDEKNILGILQ